MADDKLKTGPEPPGPDRPGDAPAKEAPPMIRYNKLRKKKET